jgi:hypothetical protein
MYLVFSIEGRCAFCSQITSPFIEITYVCLSVRGHLKLRHLRHRLRHHLPRNRKIWSGGAAEAAPRSCTLADFDRIFYAIIRSRQPSLYFHIEKQKTFHQEILGKNLLLLRKISLALSNFDIFAYFDKLDERCFIFMYILGVGYIIWTNLPKTSRCWACLGPKTVTVMLWCRNKVGQNHFVLFCSKPWSTFKWEALYLSLLHFLKGLLANTQTQGKRLRKWTSPLPISNHSELSVRDQQS